MIFELELQVGENRQEEIPFEKLILVFNTRALDELPDSTQALSHSVVVFNIHKVILVFLILVLQNLPDAPSHIEVGSSRQPSQEDLVGPEVTLAEIDKELQQNKLGRLFATDCVVVRVDAVGEPPTFVESCLLEVDLVEDLLDLHEEVDGVRFVGEVAVENGLDVAVAVVAQEGVEVLQAD